MNPDALRAADRAYAAATTKIAETRAAVSAAMAARDAARDERRRQVLAARAAGGTWQAIGDVLGVTSQRAQQIAQQAGGGPT